MIQFEIPKVDTSTFVETAISVMGPLEDWERKKLVNSSKNLGETCLIIADREHELSSIPRTMKWLKMSGDEGCPEGEMTYAFLLNGLNPGLQYKGDEAAWRFQNIKSHWFLEKVGSFDSDGSRVQRHVVRTLLCGSLSKNQDSALHRSFFRSSMREVHLLPLISKYLIEEKRVEVLYGKFSDRRAIISSLACLPQTVLSSTSSSTTFVHFHMKYDNQFLRFLPLLLSPLPNVKRIQFDGGKYDSPYIDLSLLQRADTSKLEILHITSCTYDSLSPLSLCDLSSLHTLTIEWFPKRDGNHPLNGISSEITRSLKKLQLQISSARTIDISPLSGCDLSSLEELDFSTNFHISDLSLLRGADLSSLKSLNLQYNSVSDLSPLCECKGLALEKLNLQKTYVEDISPLSLLDLSRLKEPVVLLSSKVFDLSPLENISYDGVEVDITFTPAAKKMKEEGLKSPQTIGKVKVTWSM